MATIKLEEINCFKVARLLGICTEVAQKYIEYLILKIGRYSSIRAFFDCNKNKIIQKGRENLTKNVIELFKNENLDSLNKFDINTCCSIAEHTLGQHVYDNPNSVLEKFRLISDELFTNLTLFYVKNDQYNSAVKSSKVILTELCNSITLEGDEGKVFYKSKHAEFQTVLNLSNIQVGEIETCKKEVLVSLYEYRGQMKLFLRQLKKTLEQIAKADDNILTKLNDIENAAFDNVQEILQHIHQNEHLIDGINIEDMPKSIIELKDSSFQNRVDELVSIAESSRDALVEAEEEYFEEINKKEIVLPIYMPNAYDPKNFIKKHEMFKLVSEKFNNNINDTKIIILRGRNGIGKRSFAFKYLSEHQDSNKVFYFPSIYDIDSVYRNIAKKLGFPDAKYSKIVDTSIVLNYLNPKMANIKDKVLVAFIDVNNESFPHIEPYLECLPKGTQILITTSNNLEIQSNKYCVECIEMKCFNTNDALNCIQIAGTEQLKALKGPAKRQLLKYVTEENDEIIPERLKHLFELFAVEFGLYSNTQQFMADMNTEKCFEEMLLDELSNKHKDAWKILQYAAYFHSNFISIELIQTLVFESVKQRDDIQLAVEFLKKFGFAQSTQTLDGERGIVVHQLNQQKVHEYNLKVNTSSTITEIINKSVQHFINILEALKNDASDVLQHALNILFNFSSYINSKNLLKLRKALAFYYLQFDMNYKEAIKHNTTVNDLVTRDGINSDRIRESKENFDSKLAKMFQLCGCFYYDNNRYTKAFYEFNKSIKFCNVLEFKNNNLKRLSQIRLLEKLGAIFMKAKLYEDSQKYFDSFYECCKEEYDRTKSKVVSYHLAHIQAVRGECHLVINEELNNSGKLSEAIELYKSSLETYENTYDMKIDLTDGKNVVTLFETIEKRNYIASEYKDETKINIANIYFNMARCFRLIHDLKQSVENYEAALKIQQRLYDMGNVEILQTLIQIAITRAGMDNAEETIKSCKMAISYQEKYGPHHENMKRVKLILYHHLCSAYVTQKDRDNANEIRNKFEALKFELTDCTLTLNSIIDKLNDEN